MGRQSNHSAGIYERLRDGILDGTYPVGGKLPSESSLCQLFGVSRPVIREALARLRAEGVVVSRQGAGTFVQEKSEARAVHGFAPVTNLKDIQDCFDFRIGLEAEAAFHAARNRTEEDMENLQSVWTALERAMASAEAADDEDFAFHVAIAEASGIHFFTSVITSMRPHIMVGIKLAEELSSIQQDRRKQLVQAEHSDVFTAVREQDAEAASAAMRRHLENTRRRLFDGTY